MNTLLRHARLLIAALGMLGVFFFPPYVAIACMVLLSLRFRAWETLVIGLLLDLVWLPTLSLHTLPIYTLVAIVLVWGLEPLRLQLLR